MSLWAAVLAAVAGALLGPSLHSWQVASRSWQQAGPQAPPHSEPALAGAALLQRRVLLYADATHDGVAFDPTPSGVIAVSAVAPSVASATGLAVGDVVLSLAGVAVAGDHDPLSALDEAEEAMQQQLQQQGAAVLLVVAPAGAPLSGSVSDSCSSMQAAGGIAHEAPPSAEPPGHSVPTSGWRWSRDPCQPDGKALRRQSMARTHARTLTHTRALSGSGTPRASAMRGRSPP